MTKQNNESSWSLPAALLIILLQICHVLGYMTPSMLMADIMSDLHVDYSLAGLTMTLITAVGGLFMFVGSVFQDKLGTKNILVAAGAIICAGNVICFLSPNIWVLLVGRFFNGVGYGLMTTGSYTYIDAWFKGKAKGMMTSIFLVASSMSTLLSTKFAIPLRDLTGSWRNVLGVYAVFAGVTAVCWFLFGKSNEQLDQNRLRNIEARKNGQMNFTSSFAAALKMKQIRVMICMYTLVMMAGSVSLTYAPTYITTGLGVSAAVMANAVSIRPICGMCGNFLSGLLMGWTGRRKPIIFCAILGSVGSYLLMVNAGDSTTILFIAMAFTGLTSNLPIPAINTTIMETPDEPNPSIVGASSSLVNGIASFATLAVSPIFSALTNWVGMKNGLMMMFSVLAVSAVFALFLFETGPKGKRALAAGE